MNPLEYLRGQVAAHPAICPQDLIKLCYQAANGAEHLMSDAVKQYFDEEFVAVSPREGVLCEAISDRVCRVHLDAWKAKGLPAEWLYALFRLSEWEREDINPWLNAVIELMPQAKEQINEYRCHPHPVHHSQAYRRAEAPSYRLVSVHMARLIPVLERMGRVTAIDGRAGAGKSTLAADLAAVTGACVISMDDFFLPPQLRTPERLSTPGGNIHYERFIEEVLPHIHSDQPFTYRRFDCQTMAMGEQKQVGAGWRIVEGSYSHHPYFGNYADLTVFCDVEPDEQMRRIRQRNPRMAERFKKEWIPMEEAYFSYYGIKKGLVI